MSRSKRPSSTSVAASASCTQTDSMQSHRVRQARAAALRSTGTSVRARKKAAVSTSSAACQLKLPPASHAGQGARLDSRPARGKFAACPFLRLVKQYPVCGAAPGSAVPSTLSGETKVASTARGRPPCRGMPVTTTSTCRLSEGWPCASSVSWRKTCSCTRAPASLSTRPQVFSSGRQRSLSLPSCAHAAARSPRRSNA